MSSMAVGTHSGAGPLSLMSCVRESSPLQDYEFPEHEKNAATKKKFWNPKKWFKRKNKTPDEVIVPVEIVDKDVVRSRSTSELSITDEQIRRKSGSSMHGLSISHDSVFHSPNSGSDTDLDAAQSSSSLSISQHQIDLRLQTELSERLRSRRGRGDTSEDDEGLPHSPCNSPTANEAQIEKTATKDLPTKSHSTCSDGSLLSMASSEMDEESSSRQSRHSSKLSLEERRSSDQDSDLELAPSSSSAPLNHSAAHHRVSVRPKRRAPHRSKKVPQLSTALPTTPEVNEETSIRSITPENVSKETATEHYSMSTRTTLTEIQMKCSSLPPGLAAPGDGDNGQLNRSRSSAGSKSQEHFSALEEDVEREERNDKSFFDRIFPRRSGKKRKSKEEKPPGLKPIAAPRSGPAARQRILPIDLPPSPESPKKEFETAAKPSQGGTSPLHAELESRFKQRMNPQLTPPQSPEQSVISKVEFVSKRESRSEEIRSKMKIPGLSSLQQRVLLISDEVDDGGFKSLTDLPSDKPAKPVTKSHSFKAVKAVETAQNNFVINQFNEKRAVAKAASFDSIKLLEESKEFIKKETETSESKEEVVETAPPFSDLDLDGFSEANSIIISGPSHTAVVNVSSNVVNTFSLADSKTEISTVDNKVKEVTTKESVSITKIQLKRESTQITQSTVTVPNNAVPEFLSRQLNKVEVKPVSNVVFSTNYPKVIDDLNKPKTVFTVYEKVPIVPRKFSQEDIEIVEKKEEQAVTPTQPKFRKNETNKRKSSVTSTTPDSPKKEQSLSSRSASLDSLKGESSDRSSQDSLDKVEAPPRESKSGSVVETVVLRKKSLIKQKHDDEPELMKVFARRSLKLKDSDSEAVSQQVSAMVESTTSDKENQEESPKEERRRSVVKTDDVREPLVETTKSEKRFIETAEVQLRRPAPNFYTRTFSINPPKPADTVETTVIKQSSFSERRKTDNWITNMKNGDETIERKISQDEIITALSPKSEFLAENNLLIETKNFNQRKAEWEKRAQEAQKKSVP